MDVKIEKQQDVVGTKRLTDFRMLKSWPFWPRIEPSLQPHLLTRRRPQPIHPSIHPLKIGIAIAIVVKTRICAFKSVL